MKKNYMILMLVLFLFLITGCKDKKSQNTLYIYNWDYYIPEDIIADFEKEYKVKVEYDIFLSNEEMYENIKTNKKQYDVAFPSGDYVSIMIKENMLERIEKSKIINFGLIDKKIINKMNFDIGNQYSIPYMIGAVGIAVNTKYIKNYPKNYGIFEMEEYKGKMTMLDDVREVIGSGLSYLGYSVNSINEIELEEAKRKLENWGKNIDKYDSEMFGKEFAEEKYWIVQCYAENVFLETDEKMWENIDFFIPDTGGTMYIDSMVILKNSKNKEMAYKFINYIHRPEVYAKICDWLLLPSINEGARKYIKEKPNYSIEDIEKCEFITHIDNDITKYENIWKELNLNSESN